MTIAIWIMIMIMLLISNDILENKKQLTTDIDEAKRLTTTEIYRINADLSERHKLFVVEEL